VVYSDVARKQAKETKRRLCTFVLSNAWWHCIYLYRFVSIFVAWLFIQLGQCKVQSWNCL